ncbi:hypothetical protein [Paragemmobacter ruber]|uniref:Uncharacterized protein n=1 Tax=Paragemmobacter ruber TaxID=1985673 RepID=A0ABW9Y0D6_9RHOB|nr:hypothetical protein [Rhodobacter ruber]NBE05955.1 hypothetical protein [Rhodobacter ruber]
MSNIIRTETRKRGLFGWIFLIIFWAFNALMALAFFAGMNGAAESTATLTTDAERAGAAIGTVIGAGMIVSIWAFGAIILGIFVLLTRGKKIIVETTAN